MRFRIIGTVALGLLPTLLQAEPQVVGFDRFHAATPTAEGGRLLFNELGCGNCHQVDTRLPVRRGPLVDGLTSRVRVDWLHGFLADPAKARAGTTMPHFFEAQDFTDIDAVVHYLGSLKPKYPATLKLGRHLNAEVGRDLFHTIGCVACHSPRSDFAPPEGVPKLADFTYRSISFPDLAEKYTLGSLAEFISNPLKVRPDGRMPRIELEDQEAIDLAAYLLAIEGSDPEAQPKLQPFKINPALAAKGRSIVAAKRCAACHDLPKEVFAGLVSLRNIESGCLSKTAAPGVPRYDLSDPQRFALQKFLARRDEPAPATQRARLTLEALNCVACHERDGLGGPDAARGVYFHGDHNLGDTGRLPPPLTGVGRKLQPAWLAKAITGKSRVRPYLETRMPVYGEAVSGLVELLAEADKGTEAVLPAGDDEAGRKLLGTQGGNGCITCHRWGAHASLGIQALDLADLAQRIQPGWFQEYLVNPARYQPGTLMPTFWPGGKAANTNLLEGDTARQIASIYAFAKSGSGEPAGFPTNALGEFELVPTNHPFVLRTFLEGVGTHAILVGFPERVHLAYDSLRAGPALAWKGRFFDAYNTWFSRFAPFETPLGGSVVKWPVAAAAPDNVRSLGYRLDVQRVPTFLYSVGTVRVGDRFEAFEEGLRRSVIWDASALASPGLTHPIGVAVTEAPGSAPGKRTYIYTWK